MPTMMTMTNKKTSKSRLTGSEFFQLIADKVGIKRKVVRDTIFALTDVSVSQLRKTKEVRIPHLGKILIKDIPAKKIPAGNYANPFKRAADGQPLVEYKEARVRPAKRKFKFSFAAQIKKPLQK